MAIKITKEGFDNELKGLDKFQLRDLETKLSIDLVSIQAEIDKVTVKFVNLTDDQKYDMCFSMRRRANYIVAKRYAVKNALNNIAWIEKKEHRDRHIAENKWRLLKKAMKSLLDEDTVKLVLSEYERLKDDDKTIQIAKAAYLPDDEQKKRLSEIT